MNASEKNINDSSSKSNANLDIESMRSTALGNMNVSGKQYHSKLPDELEPWYCYTLDGGHSILSVLAQHWEKAKSNPAEHMIPLPVRDVLKNYRIEGNIVVVLGIGDGEEY